MGSEAVEFRYLLVCTPLHMKCLSVDDISIVTVRDLKERTKDWTRINHHCQMNEMN